MKKAALVCALLLLASTAFAQYDQLFFKGTYEQAQAKAQAEGKKLLFYFNSYT
jgi:hypothetical protein